VLVHSDTRLAHLSAGGVSLVLDWSDGRVPVVAHWGAEVTGGDEASIVALARVAQPAVDLAHSPVDAVRSRLLLLESDAWKGRPGLVGHRPATGSAWAPVLEIVSVDVDASVAEQTGSVLSAGSGRLVFGLRDSAAQIEVELALELLPSGLLRARARLANTGEDDYLLGELAVAMPLPATADEVLDFTGRWSRERIPERMPLGVNVHMHEGRHGRTGFDSPPMLMCGTAGFGFARGEVHGVHVGFSGNHRTWVERVPSGMRVICGGELLLPGEGALAPRAEYESPWIYFGRGDGLDEAAAQVHAWLRSRPEHPGILRPVTLNVWEAVYFDHDLDRLIRLAEHAAAVGVERFVLDDGWFTGRRNDHAGLGDWAVDADVWPNGLHPLVRRVRELGMEFGLWVEPEMINVDSDVARAHPEWVAASGADLPLEWRHQQVLDLTNPDAYAHLLGELGGILAEYDIGYLKWDHNRDLIAAGSPVAGGAPIAHAQTLACYRLMDELVARTPGLEIESCASGGGRIDLGMVEHVQRFWPSDCIDPVERQDIMRWTAQLMPYELLGAHVASPRSRTTGRVSDLSFRAATALFGHFGIEWDLTSASDEELAALGEWVQYHKRHRALIFSGRLHRSDFDEGALRLDGVVAVDRSRALFSLVSLRRGSVATIGKVPVPGLDPRASYRVSVHAPGPVTGLIATPWLQQHGIVVTGSVLTLSGLQVPEMHAEQALILEFQEVPATL